MKKIVIFAFLPIFAIVFFTGCSKPVLPIELKESHKRIAIAPFATEEDSASMERRFPLDLATRLSIAEKEREWVYDQSDTLSPVGDALKNQGLEPNDIFMDSALAAKIGKELNVDEPVLTVKEDAKRGEIKRAFAKFNKGKLKNRVLLSKFVDMVAA